MSVLLLIVGFVLVIKGADFLVDGGSSLAKKLHISDLVVGLTVVAFGTSLPELSVNITASMNGSSEIAITNILGSNTANILLILGISAIVFPLTVTHGTVYKEIPFSLLAALVLAVMAGDKIIDGKITSELSRIDGLILLAFFVIFIYYTAGIAQDTSTMTEQVNKNIYSLKKSATLITTGLILLVFGGNWIVSGAIDIAHYFNISESVIGATIVAVGTSIPELATSVVAAFKKNPEIAVGNVVGSNIFNIFFILGISSVIKPLPIHSSDILHFAAVIIASMFLFIFMFTGKRKIIDRWEGWLLLSGYVIYIFLILII
ncbi:MAG: calcium/sodium antiporter [Sedimentisphaerales bacterium]|nr:calcium/sodium antiporter [Sedimentisphaerales bacterium]